MKIFIKNIFSLFGIIALLAIMAFTLISCPGADEIDNTGNTNNSNTVNNNTDNTSNPDPELPNYLQYTTWKNKNDDTVTFSATTIKIKVTSGEYTYTFKESQYIQEMDWTVFYFKNTEQTEAVTVKSQKVSMVNFNCIAQSYRGGTDQWSSCDTIINGMTFKYSNNSVNSKHYTLTKYNGNETNVVIPSNVNGLPVASIGKWAFSGYTSLTNITIPDSVTRIEEGAFVNCTNLTSIIIPNSVTSIGRSAFNYCTSLTSITIPNI